MCRERGQSKVLGLPCNATLILLANSGCWQRLSVSPPAPEASKGAVNANSPVPTPVEGEWTRVARVIDGDTVELSDGGTVRYIGLNTPEEGQPFFHEAKEAKCQLVEGKHVLLQFDVNPIDDYGRWLAYAFVDGRFGNYELLRNGFANEYTVPPNVKYENVLRQEEKEARAEGAGLWMSGTPGLSIAHVEADAPGDDSASPNGEWVRILNAAPSPVQLTGHTLADEADHVYVFDRLWLSPGQSVRVHRGQGHNSSAEVYWGLEGQSLCNNSGDTAYLRDP